MVCFRTKRVVGTFEITRLAAGNLLTLSGRNLRSLPVNRAFPIPLFIGCLLVSPFGNRSALSQGVQIETAQPAGQHSPQAHPSASPQQPAPPPAPTAAEALFAYLQKYNIEVAKYQLGTRYIWTDRVLIEISEGPPPEPLASLLAAGPNNTSQFQTWVHETFETQVKNWRPGKRNPNPGKPGTDELIGSTAGDHCFVNPVYLAYVMARYPNASILIKGPTDPALFTVNGQLRVILSPWTQLPDGTPLL